MRALLGYFGGHFVLLVRMDGESSEPPWCRRERRKRCSCSMRSSRTDCGADRRYRWPLVRIAEAKTQRVRGREPSARRSDFPCCRRRPCRDRVPFCGVRLRWRRLTMRGRPSRVRSLCPSERSFPLMAERKCLRWRKIPGSRRQSRRAAGTNRWTLSPGWGQIDVHRWEAQWAAGKTGAAR